MSKLILLTQGKFAIVDDEDYESVMRFKWYAVNCNGLWYAKTGIPLGTTHNPKRKKWMAHMYLHRFLLHPPQGLRIDHINHNGLDCKRSNMRLCTQSDNVHNSRPRKNVSSIYKGVSWCTRDKCWRAHISINKKHLALGTYHSEIKAAKAYDKKAKILFGEFACTNFAL